MKLQKISALWTAMMLPPPAHTLATRELADAHRELLRHQSAAEYYTALVAYNQTRIARLAKYLTEQRHA
jgi:hypothetical protein